MTDITELAQSLKAAAKRATPGQWVAFTDTPSRTFSVHTPDDNRCGDVIKWAGFDGQRKAKANAEFIALANPANVKMLVEALEKAQRYIEELREWNAGLAQESFERQQCIIELQQRHEVDPRTHEIIDLKESIAELETIRAAAEKLVRCKGRYHSELNYRALAALFGVNTPDLPPLEHENVHYADAAEMEIAALRQRIAELEFIRTSADKVQREFAEELGCAGDNESILQAIEDLKVQSNTSLELKQAALADNAHLKLELGILESSHKKLQEGMAAIYNAICADGASTSVSAILTFVKRAHAESAAAGIKVEAE